ncbi:MAG: type II toxin-antitoxin system VapC family toxin [Terriglobales bacterium]
MTPVLLDTGVIVALLDRRERLHHRCVSALSGLTRTLATCEAVIAESCYSLRGLPGAPEAVLGNVESGAFALPFAISHSAAAVRALMKKYRDVPADFADACLIQLADELDTGAILTLDADFRLYRWRRTRPFELFIELDGV